MAALEALLHPRTMLRPDRYSPDQHLPADAERKQ
jgi:hypothetical protein